MRSAEGRNEDGYSFNKGGHSRLKMAFGPKLEGDEV